jgi:tetratricopeptide (TPR) repeat protein
MNKSEILELDERIRRMKFAGVADCSEVLYKEMERPDISKDDLLILQSTLAMELQQQGRFLEAEGVIKERIKLEPDIPDAWISLALNFFYYGKDLEKALAAINVALEKAENDRNFYRHAHLERIRIAMAMNEYSLVEQSLDVLSDYVPAPGVYDVCLESEFLPRIPDGKVNKAVIKRYMKRVSAENT